MSRRFMRISFLSKFFLFYFSVLFGECVTVLGKFIAAVQREREKGLCGLKARTTPYKNGVKWLVIKLILRTFKCDAISI